ncbi:hypothetical protein B0T26DRAFT_750910 [Lasiosphaeria miniovina]|uniref:Uncharacterized protein n=1 Tax=Lasiosphaeria miniovina TaxID=1954250 RepID=A0AA40DXK7_9PEZI|nr:uncharacterized protein B0T26DRAFT_750910 [Lasiosphaeria miniovina]KAK0716766.1 hypothetical protein B0T26DRAFT_750910 [Lasiosphaeria miniovina]
MPTFKLPPDSNVTLEPPAPSRYYLKASSTHIYLALVAIAILVAARLATARRSPSRKGHPSVPVNSSNSNSSHSQEPKLGLSLDSWKDSAASCGKRGSAVRPPPWARQQQGGHLSSVCESQQAVWAAGLVSLGVPFGPAGQLPAMDGNDGDRAKDHSGSAWPTSRGVSTSIPGIPSTHDQTHHQHDPSLASPHSRSTAEIRRSGSSQYSPIQALPSRRQSGSSDGASSQISSGKGKGLMDDHASWSAAGSSRGVMLDDDVMIMPWGDGPSVDGATQETGFADVDYTASRHFSRPPPPPPLTPPTLSSAVFPFEDRRHSYAVSVPPELLDDSFIHRPNPDYMAGSTSADIVSSSPKSETSMPRRRSYTKSVAIGIPIPNLGSASSSAETMTSSRTFSPASYPPTSPLLPPPPPGQDFPPDYEFVGGPGGHGIGPASQDEIDLQGEIISVVDGAGHGWKRHTRVYGGGVCLACIAAGGQGGFYGDKVPLADRR